MKILLTISIMVSLVLWCWMGMSIGRDMIVKDLNKGKYCVAPYKDLPMLRKCWIIKEIKMEVM